VVAPPRVDAPTTGSLRAASDDTLFIAIPGPETLRLPVDLVRSLEFNRGRSASADAAIGCVAGAALGATVAALAIERSDLKDALVTVAALIGGAVGLVIGIVYGRSHDRWTAVEPSRVRVVVAPRGDAVGLAIGF
jgi:hypothetical protein